MANYLLSSEQKRKKRDPEPAKRLPQVKENFPHVFTLSSGQTMYRSKAPIQNSKTGRHSNKGLEG